LCIALGRIIGIIWFVVNLDETVKLTKYFENRVPPEHRDKIGFLVKAQGNKIIIAERRPFFMDRSKWTTSEFIRMVYTDYDNRWHLYWKRSSGKWSPFAPEKPVFTVEDCIREFDGKSATPFWG